MSNDPQSSSELHQTPLFKDLAVSGTFHRLPFVNILLRNLMFDDVDEDDRPQNKRSSRDQLPSIHQSKSESIRSAQMASDLERTILLSVSHEP